MLILSNFFRLNNFIYNYAKNVANIIKNNIDACVIIVYPHEKSIISNSKSLIFVN